MGFLSWLGDRLRPRRRREAAGAEPRALPPAPPAEHGPRRDRAGGGRRRAGRLPPAAPGRSPFEVLLARPGDLIDRYRSHPGYGAGPEVLTSAFRLAEQGYPAMQCDLFEDLIENDSHLRAVISSRVTPVAAAPKSIEPGGAGGASQAAAEMLARAIGRTNFGEASAHQLRARYDGYRASEITWGRSPEGAVVPRWFSPVPSRRFRFDAEDRPRLLTDVDSVGMPLEPGHWLWSQNGTGIIARLGMMRTLAWPALFKRLTIRDWVIYCNKYGIPLAEGVYNEDLHDDLIDELEEAVSNIGEDGQAIHSDRAEIKIHHSALQGGGDSVFGALVNLCNWEMSKLVNGGTLNVETQGIGSHAQATTHEQRSYELIRGDAEWLSEAFRLCVAEPFLAYNQFPAGTEPPILRIQVVADMTPLTRASVFKTLREIGLPLSKRQMRYDFQAHEPEGPEDELAAAPAPSPGSPSGGNLLP